MKIVTQDDLVQAAREGEKGLCPAGVKITAGRFETHTGTESAQDSRNFNITRGLLWTMQPHNFTGVKFSAKGLSIAAKKRGGKKKKSAPR